ncbi:hypothetical protein T12_2019 [Trichinella patagoniensis]|uniref:Uncharacterized protein n=1 Tax=Trichinella patagoniensis TaxID=990121 RepID=A0A0V0ZDU3_9BILA|nr:hypothetical protein T12_2019 [Trichinella patagoniensis]
MKSFGRRRSVPGLLLQIQFKTLPTDFIEFNTPDGQFFSANDAYQVIKAASIINSFTMHQQYLFIKYSQIISAQLNYTNIDTH